MAKGRMGLEKLDAIEMEGAFAFVLRGLFKRSPKGRKGFYFTARFNLGDSQEIVAVTLRDLADAIEKWDGK